MNVGKNVLILYVYMHLYMIYICIIVPIRVNQYCVLLDKF